MDGLTRSVGDGISGLVGGAIASIGHALDGMVGALSRALPAGALPVVGIAALVLVVLVVVRR
jgi:hypothetical protein